jgi:NAD(P)-dependent dehydrogenase (short-subunit alcohol dehydrogenase family)
VVNELAGKVAIVTGGASGIGRGTVEKFAAEGARVVIADVETDKGEALAVALGPDTYFRRTDVSDPDQIGALVATAVERFGGLHVMVNNAGVSDTRHRRFLDDDLADFHRIMAVDVLGVMAGTRDAARHMAANGGGSIINITSIGAIPGGGGVMTHAASRAAVIQFTKSAAIELARDEIRVNAIVPGNMPAPVKREGTPGDVAEAALYIAGDRSRYVTGAVLPVGGG